MNPKKEANMQIDMHFYGVYALARAAGVKPEAARTIAHASQFVDDAVDDEVVLTEDHRAILPTMTSHKPLDYENFIPGDQWKVWVPFHFLPGNESESGEFVEKMICRMNSKPARSMVQNALDSKNKDFWPHLIGITAHVYADTFAHFGFVGFSDPRNQVKSDSITAKPKSPAIMRYITSKFEEFKTRFLGNFAEIVPVGHGAVGTFPDRPYLSWQFEYEIGEHKPGEKRRNNTRNFLKGCQSLYDFFRKFAEVSQEDADSNGGKDWNDVLAEVGTLLRQETPKDERIKSWKEAITSGKFCDATPADTEIDYIEGLWRPRRAEYARGEGGEVSETDACRFIRAAWRHREYVLRELLPELDLIAY
jgi:hypothetical protein